jgi:hypothetical protein
MLNGFSIPASAKEQAFKQMKSGLSNKYDKKTKLALIEQLDFEKQTDASALLEKRTESL